MLSRVADSLYWMGRYLERAEHTARLLDVNLTSMLDQDPSSATSRWVRLLASLNAPAAATEAAHHATDAAAVAQRLIFEPAGHLSLRACISAARENARQVRQQISSEMWEEINRLYLEVRQARFADVWAAQPHEFLKQVISGCHQFLGTTAATLNHGEGFYFIDLGRNIERTGAIAALLMTHFCGPAAIARLSTEGAAQSEADDEAEYLELVGLLKSCCAFEAYCRHYTQEIISTQVVEYLLLNPEFPRSVLFCANRMQQNLEGIAKSVDSRKSNRAYRLAGKLSSSLTFVQLDEVLASGMDAFLLDMQRQCGSIHAALRHIYIAYPIETALAN